MNILDSFIHDMSAYEEISAKW